MPFRGTHHVVASVELGNDLQIALTLQTAAQQAAAEDLVGLHEQQPDPVGQTDLRGNRPGAGEVRPGGMSSTRFQIMKPGPSAPSTSTRHLYQIAHQIATPPEPPQPTTSPQPPTTQSPKHQSAANPNGPATPSTPASRLGFPSYRGEVDFEEVGDGRKDRKFDEDFKAGAVQLVEETGKPIAQVARELGVNEGTLGNWVRQARRAGTAGRPS